MKDSIETEYLQSVLAAVARAADEISCSLDTNEENYQALKRYTVAYKNELDKYEVYNHQQSLTFLDKRSQLESNILDKLAYQQETPYFAKIGFRYEEETVTEPFYIGRYGFADQLGSQLIYDWRAPIAGLYYDFGLGPAAYEAFDQHFAGELTEKKQFVINGGQIQLLTDTNEAVSDQVLLQELGQTSSSQMKTIIQTIQKEQNQAIRDQRTKHLIIQGVAGSGKTSIALHRIAYLLYQRKAVLSAEDVLIVSPNQIFASYIGNVLPEMGEQELQQVSLAQLGQSFLEPGLEVGDRQREMAESLQNPQALHSQIYLYKRSRVFFEKIMAYFENLRQRLFSAALYQEAAIQITPALLQRVVENYGDLPLGPLIQKIAQLAAEEGGLANEAKLLPRKLQQLLKIENSLTCYLGFLSSLPETVGGTTSLTYLEDSDLFPYLLFKLQLEGLPPNKAIKQLVVDEMQDYSLLQFYVLQQLFPCEKTLCGDVEQRLTGGDRDFLTELQKILPDSRLLVFNTSYRSSWEIIDYAKKFSNNPALTAVERHGSPVIVSTSVDLPTSQAQLENWLAAFTAGEYHSCGIICQTAQEVALWQERLAPQWPLKVLEVDEPAETDGISLTTIQFAKGLEFDTVILPDIKEEQLTKKSNLLYTSCTRALHELKLLVQHE